MSEAVTPVSPLAPGPLAMQARAIAARLQLVFPPSKFHFKYLPAAINKDVWRDLTQGNQPFIGLGFANFSPTTEGAVLGGVASWMVLTAIRRVGQPASRLFGDAQAPVGVLAMATAAAGVLQGFVAHTGSVTVGKIANTASEAFTDDSTVISIDLRVPMTLNVAELITRPDGLGIFEELSTTWNEPTASGGSTDIYTSDWENPNG